MQIVDENVQWKRLIKRPDENADVDSVARLESFRALKFSKFERFRALKLSGFESFMALKISILAEIWVTQDVQNKSLLSGGKLKDPKTLQSAQFVIRKKKIH